MENRIYSGRKSQGIIKKTNIYSGGFELIDTNSVLYYDSDSPMEIEVVFSAYFKILIKFVSVKNETKKRALKVEVDTKDNIVIYKCINFNNSLGSGTSQPIELGTVQGKKMFINFWIYARGKDDAPRKIEYSIWKEK